MRATAARYRLTTRTATVPISVDLGVGIDAPVIFACLSNGAFLENGLNYLVVRTDSAGRSSANFLVPSTPGTFEVRCSSPIASNVVTYLFEAK
jgi:hypothetical protein